MFIKFFWFSVIFLSMTVSSALGEVKSTSSSMIFDVQFDGQPEMTLNSVGLGVGMLPSANLSVSGNAIVSGTLVVGGMTNTSGSNLHVNGTMGLSVQSVSANTTLSSNSIVMVDTSSTNINMILPYAGNCQGRQYIIKKITNTNTLWVSGGGNALDGVPAVELTTGGNSTYPYLTTLSDGRNWHILGQSASGITTVASSNLIGWWKLDETTGTSVADSSGSGYTGTLSGVSFSGNSVDGNFGKAVSFGGSTGTISTADIDVPSSNLFTVSVWYKHSVAQISDYGALITKGSPTSSIPYGIWIQKTSGNNGPAAFCSSNAIFHATTSQSTMDGKWHHAALVIAVPNMYLYSDGSLLGSKTTLSTVNANNNSTTIGGDGTTTRAFNGEIDEVRIYNRALTSAEIKALSTR